MYPKEVHDEGAESDSVVSWADSETGLGSRSTAIQEAVSLTIAAELLRLEKPTLEPSKEKTMGLLKALWKLFMELVTQHEENKAALLRGAGWSYDLNEVGQIHTDDSGVTFYRLGRPLPNQETERVKVDLSEAQLRQARRDFQYWRACQGMAMNQSRYK